MPCYRENQKKKGCFANAAGIYLLKVKNRNQVQCVKSVQN